MGPWGKTIAHDKLGPDTYSDRTCSKLDSISAFGQLTAGIYVHAVYGEMACAITQRHASTPRITDSGTHLHLRDGCLPGMADGNVSFPCARNCIDFNTRCGRR